MLPSRFFLDNALDNFFADNDKMKCDIYEKDGIYHVEMDLPGFSKDDIKIEVNNGNLTISAEKSNEDEEEDKKYYRRERRYGKYSRSFYLGEVDEEKINAAFNNGTLTISIPKIDEEKAKKYIDIE